MASDITWIKVAVATFSDEKIKLIQSMPDGDAITVIWFRLLMQAGKSNAGGLVQMSNGKPYTLQMLATLFDRTPVLMEFAMKTFVEFGMVETTSQGFYIVNWEKHQNVEGMERVREKTRERVAKHRANQKKILIGLSSACEYCGSSEAITIDHIIPRSKGGEDTSENTVSACKTCNSAKKDKDLVDFLNDTLIYMQMGHPTARLDIGLVDSNAKLAHYVYFDESLKRFCNVTKRESNATDIEVDKELKHMRDSPVSKDGYTSDFDQFWSVYPKKKEKSAAFKTWKARLKEGVSPVTLITAAENYAKDCKRKGTEESYIKYPKTFLGSSKPYEDYLMNPVQHIEPKSSQQKELSPEDEESKRLLEERMNIAYAARGYIQN